MSAVLLGAALCACTPSAEDVKGRHSAAAKPAAAVASAAPAATPQARDADLVTAVAMSKVKLPFELRFRIDSKPLVGQPVKIELVVTLAPQAQVRSLQFHLQPGSDLLLQDDPEFIVNGAAPGTSVRREVLVVPQAAGVLELEARAALESSADSLSQTYSMPLIAQSVAAR